MPSSAATTMAASGPAGPLSVTVPAIVGSRRSGLEKRSASTLSVGTPTVPTSGTEVASCGLSLGSGVVGRAASWVNLPCAGSNTSPAVSAAPSAPAPPQSNTRPSARRVAVAPRRGVERGLDRLNRGCDWVEQLGVAQHLALRRMAAGEEDPAVGEERGSVFSPRQQTRRWYEVKGLHGRVENFEDGGHLPTRVDAAADEHRAVGEHGGGVPGTSLEQGLRDRRQVAGLWIEDRGGREWSLPSLSAEEEPTSIGQEGPRLPWHHRQRRLRTGPARSVRKEHHRQEQAVGNRPTKSHGLVTWMSRPPM